MKAKIRLSVILSVAFHAVLVLGLFSRADHSGREAEGLIVELVSLGQVESAPLLASDSTGSSELLPPEPAFPMESDEHFDPIEEDVPPPSEPFFNPDAEEQFPPPLHQEEQEGTLPEESVPPFDPDFPSTEDAEESLPEEQANLEPDFRLVAEVGRSEKGSAGTISGEGTGEGFPAESTLQPTVSDALSSGIGGVGGGQIGPRFVIPKVGRSNPKPHYPERARAEGREGTALLRVTVLSTGKVGEALIEQSSGHADLDRSAVEAVMKWTFLPARRGESPVTSSVRIPVTFALDRP